MPLKREVKIKDKNHTSLATDWVYTDTPNLFGIGELLPHLFTLTTDVAVIFCCTFP